MKRAARYQRGLSLVELMVSVAISLAVLSALSYVYLGSRGAYRSNEALARVQEAGRFALDWIARDLRHVGYMGCLSRGIEPVDHVNPAIPGGVGASVALQGWERGVGWTNTSGIPRWPGDSDVLELGGMLEGVLSPVFDSVNGEIRVVDNCPGFITGTIAIVANCERAAVFRVTNAPRAPYCPDPPDLVPAANVVLVHAATLFGGPANGGNGIVATNVISPLFNSAERSFVARFQKVRYFVGRNPQTERPGLYRSIFGGRTEEVVNNVEDMDLLFGLDTDGDSSVDSYRKADAITAAEWPSVLSVRVGLLVVSDETAATPGSQVVFLRDVGGDTLPDAQAAPDRRLRQVFTTTVALRNRMP